MRVITENSLWGRNYDVIYIGNTPNDEPCTQVDQSVDYLPAQKRECEVLAGQLTRMYGEPPTGASFCIMKNYHDFGVYYELVVRYLVGNEEAEDYALRCENLPDHWDDTARRQLSKETVG